MTLDEYSVYAPRAEYEPPVPDWKKFEVFSDALPKTGPTAVSEEDLR
jgi:hypothetical protein